jgi:hypothetical protein
MLFNIEVDEGSRISGYLVPDSYSESASLSVRENGVELLTLPCEDTREALIVAGRHESGRCGFVIDQTTIPNLKDRTTLEIYDAKSDILIYRRRPPSDLLQRRILRLETRLVPLWRLDDVFDSRFQFFYKSVERYGRETINQLFLLSNSSSLYLSGRFPFKAYESHIDESFQCIILMRDPYTELAERLLALKHIGDLADQLLGERDRITLSPAIEFSASLTENPSNLDRSFASMSKAAINSLGNPLTRQLAAQGADDAPARGAVGRALGTLAHFTIVGIQEQEGLFREQVAELLGTPIEVVPSSRDLPASRKLANELKRIPEAGVLIGQDIELYEQVRSAILGVT